MSTPAQIAANQSNAQLSTGPKTEAGKAKVSHNAVKTALTGLTILLPTDDVAAYENLGKMLIERYQPANFEENLLVQSLIDTEWRLIRIPGLEEGILAVGRTQLAETVSPKLLEVEVYLKYERQLKNLSLQENRLRRNREKDRAQLLALQTVRREQELAQRKMADLKAKQQQQQPAPPAQAAAPQNGFEISIPVSPTAPPIKNAA